MNHQINAFFDKRKDIGPFIIRLVLGIRLIYGVMDNVLNWDRMVEFKEFLELHHFPFPMISAVVSVYAQLFCGLLFLVGIYVRTASIVMILNFSIAIYTVHIDDSFLNTFPALVMLGGSLSLLFSGAGRYAVRI